MSATLTVISKASILSGAQLLAQGPHPARNYSSLWPAMYARKNEYSEPAMSLSPQVRNEAHLEFHDIMEIFTLTNKARTNLGYSSSGLIKSQRWSR